MHTTSVNISFSDQVKIQAKLCFHFLVSMLPKFLYVSHTDISDILMTAHNKVFFKYYFHLNSFKCDDNQLEPVKDDDGGKQM